MTNYTENNKRLWNGLTEINAKSDFYDVEGFKAGKSTLKKIELSELGDVTGKSLLHLQCHFGLDTLSLARAGAKVTGVDLSDKAIKLAKHLSTDLKLLAEFICSDIYKLPEVLDKKFDIVFTSYGVLVWLNNLNKWADVIAHFLKPGATFYIVEFHPFTNMFDEQWHALTDSYFYGNEPIQITQRGSYADTLANFSHVSYEWPHTMSEIITALRQAGLIIDFFHEFPFSSYNCFPSLKQSGVDEYTIKNDNKLLPLMFSIKATYMPELALKTHK